MVDVQALRDLLEQHRLFAAEKTDLSAETKRLKARLEELGGPAGLSAEDNLDLLWTTVEMLTARIETIETKQDALWDALLVGVIELAERVPY